MTSAAVRNSGGKEATPAPRPHRWRTSQETGDTQTCELSSRNSFVVLASNRGQSSSRTCVPHAKWNLPKIIHCMSSVHASETLNALRQSITCKSPTTASDQQANRPLQKRCENRCGTAQNQAVSIRAPKQKNLTNGCHTKRNGHVRKHATVRTGRYWIRTSVEILGEFADFARCGYTGGSIDARKA